MVQGHTGTELDLIIKAIQDPFGRKEAEEQKKLNEIEDQRVEDLLRSDIKKLVAGAVALVCVVGGAGSIQEYNQALNKAVADNDHMSHYVISKAQGRVFDAKTDAALNEKIKKFCSDYLPGCDQHLKGKTWIENYSILSASVLSPENDGNRKLKEGFAILTGTINAKVDHEPIKVQWKADTKGLQGLIAKPQTTFAQTLAAAG